MKTLVYADLDNIVFEGRHREYGAYQMRKRYNRYLIRALLVTFLAFISLTGFPKIVHWLMPADAEIPTETLLVTEVAALPPPPPLAEEIPEVAPPPPPTPPTVRTVAFLIPDPVPDDLVSDSATIADIEALDSSVVALVDQEGDDPGDYYNFDEFGPGDVPGEIFVKEETEREIPADTFMILESEPMAVNMDDLQKLIGYPDMAIEAEIEGKVVLRVYIDKRGDYKKHLVVKDPHPILTAAVSKHINKLKMTPGIQSGRPINVWVTVPFNFTLTR